jgi:hypothetical protein
MSRFRPTRRQFIRGAGGALALPFLPSLLSGGVALGQGATRPKRFIAIQIGHGFFPEEWFPYVAANHTPEYAAFKSAPYELLAAEEEQIRVLDLKKLDGQIAPQLRSFEAIKDKLLFVQGLSSLDGWGHNSTSALGGFIDAPFPGETIDQVLARKIYAAEPAQRVMNLSGMHFENISVVQTAAGFQKAPLIKDTMTIDKLLFEPLRANTDAQVKRDAQTNQKTLVDFLVGDLNKAMNGSRISGDDKKRLQAHIDFMHELQKRRLAAAGVQCIPPPAQAQAYYDGWGNFIAPVEIRELVEQSYYDTILGAIKCGLCNVFTLTINAIGPGYDFLGGGDSELYHSRTHEKDMAHIGPVHTYYMDKVANLIKSLMDIEDPETNETYLDNTLIFLTAEISPWAHDRRDLNVLLAGNVNNYFATGRAVSFQNYAEVAQGGGLFGGRPYTRMLYSILDAYGLKAGDYGTFSPVNKNAHADQKFMSLGDWQQPLPFLKAS